MLALSVVAGVVTLTLVRLIALSITFVTYYRHYLINVDDSTLDVGPGIYWQLAFLACTNIVPSIQSLKSMAEMMSTSGAVVGGTVHGSGDRSVSLQDTSSRLKRPRANNNFTPDTYGRKARVSHTRPVDIDSESVGSDRSDRMIIRQEIRWEVTVDG